MSNWKTWLIETFSSGLQSAAAAGVAVTVTPAWTWKTVAAVFLSTFGISLLNRLSRSPLPIVGDGTGTK